ncbi:hypothetical protein JOQ06_007676, partial [Pogonophryne albipinna]
ACSGVSNIAHLEMDLQREGDASPLAPDEGAQLQELPFTPVHAPVITLGMNVPSSCSASSRSALAHLYSAGFPNIIDSDGQVAEVLDPTEPVTFDPRREEIDPLQGNLLVFQFLAFTRIPTAGVGPDWPDNIYFTFQFYRFPPVTSQQLKLLISDNVQQKASVPLPCVLASISKDGTVNSALTALLRVVDHRQDFQPACSAVYTPGSPGLQVQFKVDESFLRQGEKRWFLRYLALHTMHIDIWDSDSLLLIGSTAIELKFMLRQGRLAVQALQEVEVLTTDYVVEDILLTSADPGQRTTISPMTVQTIIRGRLHPWGEKGNLVILKGQWPGTGRQNKSNIADFACLLTFVLGAGKSLVCWGLNLENCQWSKEGVQGCPVDPSKRKAADVMPSHPHIITPCVVTGGFRGGSLSSRNILRLNARNAAQAHRLEMDGDSGPLFGRGIGSDSFVPADHNLSEADGVRRKLDCMAAVHQQEGKEEAEVTGRTKEARLARGLNKMKPSEQHSKAECIANMLSQAITTQHLLYASLGSAEYTEFVLRNPFNTPQTVTVHIDDPELSVITDTEEWGYFKALTKTPTALEENMFHLEEGAPGPRVYLRPKESLHIPLKYQSFICDHTMALQGPSFLPTGKGSQLAKKNLSNIVAAKTIKVTFKAEDGKPMAICQLNVEPTPHVVDQTFRLYHPELCFLKKAIRLPPWHDPSVADVSHISVRCSDPNIICQTRMLVPGEPQDVYLKVPGSPSPLIKMFFVMVFTDKWMAAPSQIWQIYVHFLERVDVSCVSGQRSCQSLVLRGKQAVRKVKCFSSHPQEIEACTDQERATAASLRVAWILGKKKRPFTDAETVKECMLASIEEVVADEKIRKIVIDSIKNIPISDTSTSRRVETLASDVFEILLDKLRKAEVMSLAIDESTDSSDVAQLCLYVRFFDGECFREDLLGLIPLDGHTTGEVMFHKVVSFFKEHKLGLDRINMLVTDGAPAMSGGTQRLSARLADVAPQLRSLHCLIHQSFLCAKLSDVVRHVDPEAVFVLPPAAVQELQLKVQPWRAGSRFLYVNAVDVENRRLVASWLLCLNVHRPVLSKAFEVCVPVGSGRGSSRKITYTNPYTSSRSFLLRSDHPDLLQFKEDQFQIGGGESYTIGLRFAPSQSPGSVEILVYVNNLQERTEETFCVKVNYS